MEYEVSKRRLIGPDYKLALKLVRGAYIAEEHRLEKELGLDIVHDSKHETDVNYDDCAALIAQELDAQSRFIVASHNEPSVEKLLLAAAEKPLLKDTLIFATLFGLSDYMSIGVRELGFVPMKYLPYGERNITLPYLLRRGVEARKMIIDDYELMPNIRKELIKRFTFSNY